MVIGGASATRDGKGEVRHVPDVDNAKIKHHLSDKPFFSHLIICESSLIHTEQTETVGNVSLPSYTRLSY